MAQAILIERKGPFAFLTLNRPRRGNLINDAMMRKLPETIDGLAADKNLRAVVLRGSGPDFCLGRDQRPGPGGPPKSAFELHDRVMSRILAVYKAFRECPAPIVSTVQGRALGFGCAMVGGSDIAYAAEDARFSLPEMTHRTAPTLAISALAKVAPKTVMDMVLSVDEIDANTALASGLVSRVVAPDALDASIDALLEKLAGYDVAAIRTVKRFVATGPGLAPDIMSDLAGYTLATVGTRPK